MLIQQKLVLGRLNLSKEKRVSSEILQSIRVACYMQLWTVGRLYRFAHVCIRTVVSVDKRLARRVRVFASGLQGQWD